MQRLMQRRVEPGAPHLQHAPRLLDDILQLGGLVDGVRHRLLEIHVLARQDGRPRDGVVQVIGDHDHHAVDVGAGKQRAVVTTRALGARLRLRVVHARLPDVAHLHEVDVALPVAPGKEAAPQQVLELHAAADEAEPDAIVGAEHAAGRPGRLRGVGGKYGAGQRHARDGAGGLTEELTTSGGLHGRKDTGNGAGRS